MKDRLSTLLFAVVAFLLSIFLLMQPQLPDRQLSLPTTEDRGSEGLKGLYRWLESNKIAVYSLRKHFTDLINSEDLVAVGNLLILSMPQPLKAMESEWHALQDWVDRGNTVIILGAGYSSPEWAGNKACFCDINQLLNGFDWDIDSDQVEVEDGPEAEEKSSSFKQTIDNLKSDLETFKPKKVQLQPQSRHTLLQAVAAVQSKIFPSKMDESWSIETENNKLALKLLALPEQPDITILWQMEAGKGQLFLSLAPDIFSNENLNKADNARLFGNILAQSLGQSGQVIFDDYHFGLSNLYDPKRFFSDSRLHKTLGFIALLWLFYVLGYSNRLAPVHTVIEKPTARDFVEAMAGFFSRHLDKKTLAQGLTRRLIHDIRQHRHLHDDQAAWQWLHQHPGLEDAHLTLLQKAEQKQRTSLQGISNTINEIREKIFL